MRSFIRALACITVFVNLLIFSSCSEEFLKKEPIGVGAGSVITTPEGVEFILTGAYSMLRGRNMFGGALGTDWVYGSVANDYWPLQQSQSDLQKRVLQQDPSYVK